MSLHGAESSILHGAEEVESPSGETYLVAVAARGWPLRPSLDNPFDVNSTGLGLSVSLVTGSVLYLAARLSRRGYKVGVFRKVGIRSRHYWKFVYKERAPNEAIAVKRCSDLRADVRAGRIAGSATG